MWTQAYEGLNVHQIPSGTNVYYVLARNGAALVVDPPESGPVRTLLARRGLRLTRVLITHGDPDHINGVAALCGGGEPLVMAPEGIVLPVPFTPAREGCCLSWEGLRIEPLDTPGHRARHVAYHLAHPAPRLLFSGDTLFAGGCGRLNGLPPELMYASLRKLAALPAETHVYGGHDYLEDNLDFALTVEPELPALHARISEVRERKRRNLPVLPGTIGMERATNPFLLAPDLAVFAARRRAKDSF